VTPGHTPGILSIVFDVRDGDKRHRAFSFGGIALNMKGVEHYENAVASVRRIKEIGGVEVNVTNHAHMGRIFERYNELLGRKPGSPNPFVDPAGYYKWLDEQLAKAEEELEEEKEKHHRIGRIVITEIISH
jgi:hypothetical protein